MSNVNTTAQIVMDLDTPRTRLTDPVESHLAADRSAETRVIVRAAVLYLVTTYKEGLTGSELNDLYELWSISRNWPRVHQDSPRKRAGELHADGLLRCESVTRGTERKYTVAS